MKLRLPTARSPSWVLAETATSAGFSFFSLILIAKVIGPEAAGLGAVAIAAFLLLDLACASLFTDALVQRAALYERHVRSARLSRHSACGHRAEVKPRSGLSGRHDATGPGGSAFRHRPWPQAPRRASRRASRRSGAGMNG